MLLPSWTEMYGSHSQHTELKSDTAPPEEQQDSKETLELPGTYSLTLRSPLPSPAPTSPLHTFSQGMCFPQAQGGFVLKQVTASGPPDNIPSAL